MNYLSLEDVAKTYGEKTLFRHVTFGLEKGQKTGLIARNGRGKSTLMQIIVGKVLPDSGTVTLRKDIRVGYLSQNPEIDADQTLIDYLLAGDNETTRLLHRYEELVDTMARQNTPALQKVWEETVSEMDRLQAWNYEDRIKEVLFRLQLPHLQQTMGTLSGGQQKKAALAKVLLADADLLLLDEPTNHLDIAMIEWLEEFLNRQNTSLLLITHDRAFLDAVCHDIVEIDGEQTYFYKGNYAYFLEKKAERESIALAEWEKAKNLYRRELEWMRRMPSARGTKARARKDAFEDLKEKVALRPKQEELTLSLQSERLGNKIMEVNHVSMGFDGHTLIKDFSYTFKRGEKIGIVGPNGSGKSTFLNLLTGKLKPEAGHIVVGQTLQIGYYEQSGLWAPGDKRVIDIIKETAEVVKTDKGQEMSASQFLQYFQFDPTTQYNYFSLLSGGERRRLYLLKTLMAHPNFLILDEPTNDLDVFTLMLLENFLQNYEGCVLMVSHDRHFMDHLVDHLFVFEGEGRIKDFYGTYSEYKKWRAASDRQAAAEAGTEKAVAAKGGAKVGSNAEANVGSPVNAATGVQPRKKPSYKQLKEKEALENEMQTLETRKRELETALCTPENYKPEEITAFSEEIGRIQTALDAAEMRWLELSEACDF